jgi:hypothetical protein
LLQSNRTCCDADLLLLLVGIPDAPALTAPLRDEASIDIYALQKLSQVLFNLRVRVFAYCQSASLSQTPSGSVEKKVTGRDKPVEDRAYRISTTLSRIPSKSVETKATGHYKPVEGQASCFLEVGHGWGFEGFRFTSSGTNSRAPLQRSAEKRTQGEESISLFVKFVSVSTRLRACVLPVLHFL